MINKKIISSASFVFIILLASSSTSTLTGITLNSPQSNANISGIYLLNATLSSGDSANFTDFWWYDGSKYHLIGENNTSGSSFTFYWNTSTINNGVIKVKANASNESVSITSNLAEEVTVDNTFPSVENISNTSIGQWSAIINFDASEKSNASIDYGTTASLGATKVDSAYLTSHSISLANLTENKTYYYNITACDFSGNCNTTGEFNFSTLNIAPSISGIQVNATNDSALISWTTNENANSSINYGTTTSLGTIAGNASNATTHSINLSGLTNGTTYYYNVTSCDLVGNCNTTGEFNFTTDLDDTPPAFEGGLTFQNSAGTVVSGVNEDEYINITASVGDNIKVDKVWAQITLENGQEFNQTMTILNGSGTLSNKYHASLYYNCTSSGLQHIIVFANDTSGNLASTSKNAWTVYGYFTFLSNVSNGYKNFTNGKTLSLLYTVINDRSSSDNYSFSFNLSQSASGSSINGSKGWLISSNGTTASNIASGAKAYFKIQVTVPLNASSTFYVNAKINSSSGKSESKSLSFPQETIAVTLPSTVKLSNSTAYSGITFDYYNYTKASWMKTINVTYFSVTSEASNNITNSTFACGLYNGTTLKKAGIVASKGNMSINKLSLSNASCLINVSSVSAGIYNLTINITNDKNHKGSAYKKIIIPSAVIISASNGSISKGMGFTLTGSAYYKEDSNFKLVSGKIEARYGATRCIGTTNYAGAFSLNCPGISTIGNTKVNITATGVFNVSSSKTITLKVTSSSKATQSERFEIVPSESELTLKKEKNLTVTVFNKYLASKEVSIKAAEKGSRQHFKVSYNASKINVASNGSAVFKITLSSFDYPKPGTYYLVITSGDFSKEVKVIIPNFKYIGNSINANRFVEKEAGKTIFGIEVFNNLSSEVVLNLTETISKEIANSTDLINFNQEPVIIQKDPIVMWVLNLSAGEKKELTYSINKNINGNNSFTEPNTFIISVGNSSSGNIVVQENKSNRIIYIVIIFILAGAGIFYILFKDELFKKKQANYLKPGLIEQSKKKLLGDGSYHFKKGKEVLKKKKEKEEYKKEPVFNFSGVEKKEED